MPGRPAPRINNRLVTVLAFIGACAVFLGYIWTQAGGSLPGAPAESGYRATVTMGDVGNLVEFSDVQVAGVNVGKVERIDQVPGGARLRLSLPGLGGPLHRGATVQASEKSLAGQGYLKLADGAGPPLPDGTELPATAVKPRVTLRDVLASLDPPTRQALGSSVRSLGAGTAGTSHGVSATLDGLAKLGREGHTALDAIAAQSTDLRSLTGELRTVFTALDTGQGRLAQVVGDANRLASTTAGQREAVQDTLQRLPGVLDTAQTAGGKLTGLGHDLAPVTTELKHAAPDVTAALRELPDTTSQLRSLLPSLDGTLTKAPATLERVPPASAQLQQFLPAAGEALRDLNPMLRYIKPYHRELPLPFVGIEAAMHRFAGNGDTYDYIQPNFGPYSVKGNPTPLAPMAPGQPDLFHQVNPYPKPGELTNEAPFSGPYPQIRRDPG